MNTFDEKRVEKIKRKILTYSQKRLELIRNNDLENAMIYSRIIILLHQKEQDIIEGIEDIMIKRKDELEEERSRLQSSLREASLLGKMEIKREIYKVDEALKEDNIREYARKEKNAKVLKKEQNNSDRNRKE